MKWQEPMIPVTRCILPPLDSYVEFLKEIWQSKQLTNFGQFSMELERRLQEYTGNRNCYYVTNGTLALQLAIKALGLTGEVITTPFSFVATSSTIFWEGCQPRFVDIDPETLNIDPNKVEEAITSRTTAILATHVYGNPCDVEALERICRKHGLKLIFDAAHCFGIDFQGRSLFNFGDVATASLHATKVFHSAEGGLVIFNDVERVEAFKGMRNFGIKGPEHIQGLGINAKNSELHAALGLALWPSIEESKNKRLAILSTYENIFSQTPSIKRQKWNTEATRNGAYYPVVFDSEATLLRVQNGLNEMNVFPRRYFYPCLSTLDYVAKTPVPIADDVARRVLCLPIFADLSTDLAQEIAEYVVQLSRV